MERGLETGHLGKPLTLTEERWYKALLSSCGALLTIDQLYAQMYPGESFDNITEDNLYHRRGVAYAYLTRLKRKLGVTEIIAEDLPSGIKGYTSRRARIEDGYYRRDFKPQEYLLCPRKESSTC